MSSPKIDLPHRCPTNEQMDRWAKVLAIAILSTIFYRFFDRVAVYHDEIINTGKAGLGNIFDYAMRPLFYAVNTAIVEFLGADPLSISFAMVGMFFVGGFYTYRYLHDRFGPLAGVSGIAAYTWLGWAYTIGIAAMPQLLPSTLLLAAWFYYQDEPVERLSALGIARIALLLWGAVLSHPTAIAAAAPIALAIGIRMSWALIKGKIPQRIFVRQVATWAAIFACLLLGTEFLYFVATDDQSYIGSWLKGLDKTSSLQYSHYFQPFNYYFVLVAKRFAPLAGCMAFLWIGAVIASRGRKSDLPQNHRASWQQAIELLAVAAASLLILSLQAWKFERVLPGFMPLFTLAFVATVNVGAQKFAFPRFMRTTTAMIVIVCSLWQFVSGMDAYKERMQRKRAVYSAYFEQVKGLPFTRVAYVGQRSLSRVARYPFQAVGKQLIHYPIAVDEHPVAKSVIAEMRAQGYRYVVINISEESPEAKQLRALMVRNRLQRIVVYQGGDYELWELKRLK